MVDLVRKCFPEFVGTAVLVFFGVGSAVFGFNVIGVAGVAFSFGLVLLALVYALGPKTGCHVNPAITLGVLLSRGISVREACGYWVAQVVGAIAGAALIRGLVGFGEVHDQTGNLGSNDWGKTINGPGDFLLEIILTLLLVVVVLLVTGKAASPGFAGLAIGLTLTVCHLVGIPLDGTSVNPARSIGPAIFNGGVPLEHVWLYIVAPLIGALIAVVLAPTLAITAPAPITGADHAKIGSSDEPVAEPEA
jgi:aquaporin Z